MLWPDAVTARSIRDLWDRLAEARLPSMATHTHRLHQPHASLVVGENLEVPAALDAIGTVPTGPIRCLASAAGLFPSGVLFLAIDPTVDLLAEQARIYQAALPVTTDPWPYFAPGSWTPHITLAMNLTVDQLTTALPIVLDHLPIDGHFDHGGAEDGTTGENWPAPPPEAD